ncbi:MAG: hypothetical protein K2L19_05830 [Eubacterium sp.]|nr:hypothetical protein [Eubacterium sp.]
MNNQQTIQEIKSFSKSTIKILSFLLVFMLLLEGMSITVFSKKAATQYQNSFSKSCSFTTEPKNSIDIALIGSSDLYSGFVPVELWDNYGYTSTVISTPKQTVQRSYTFLEELLKVQNPKLVIIETDMFYQGVPLEDKAQIEIDKPKCFSIISKAKKIIKLISTFPIGENLENHFTVFMFHDTWKTLKTNQLKKLINRDSEITCEHGYNFNKIIYPINDNDRMAATNETEPIPDENVLYIQKMLDECKSRGIRVMLIEMPSLTSWNYARYNAVKQLADNNNVEFIDLNLKENFSTSQINCDSDYRDNGNHLNYYGAVKATHFFGSIIYDKHSDILTDRRNDRQFAYWQQSSKEFKKKYNIK